MAGSFCLTDRGNAANEDFVQAAGSYGIVIDGASGLAGDPLFAGRFATNAQWLARSVGAATCAALDAGARVEEALAGANRKFRRRWSRVEELAHERGLEAESLGDTLLNELWERAKAEEKA